MWQEDLHFVEISWTAAEVLRGPEVPGVEGLKPRNSGCVIFVSPKMTGLSTAMAIQKGKMKFRKHETNSNMNSEMRKL